jgi:hypothetical protein
VEEPGTTGRLRRLMLVTDEMIYMCVKGQRAMGHVSIHVVGCAPCPHPCLQTGVGAGRAPYFFRVILNF